LVSTEGACARPTRLTCPVDIPNWFARQDLHLQHFRLERNASALGYSRSLRTATSAHGRICTDTLRVLSALPLRWATWAACAGPPSWYRVKDWASRSLAN